MFWMLAFRLANLVDTAVGALTEQHQDLARQVLQALLDTGLREEKDKDMRTKRYFDDSYKDDQQSCIKWIVAVLAHPEFMQALHVLERTRIMETAEISVEEDGATMSKTAREIRKALRASGSGFFPNPRETPKR